MGELGLSMGKGLGSVWALGGGRPEINGFWAYVCGNSRGSRNFWFFGEALLFGEASIFGEALISGADGSNLEGGGVIYGKGFGKFLGAILVPTHMAWELGGSRNFWFLGRSFWVVRQFLEKR
jgi:hypothetical protein